MSDWTAGYVADIGYTYGYYNELNPLRATLPLTAAGWVCPEMGTACELGFGQGMSIAVHAATSSTAWYGTDFNPSQAGFAQELAAVSNSQAKLYDQAFAEFCARPDLPDFDYIGLHGIWSWISDENRHIIVDFLRRKLKVGGVLYISYNTNPGWASMVPMRELLNQHTAVLGAAGEGIVSRIDSALKFAGQMLETNPLYAKANPQVADRIKRMQEQNRHYLAHEYFNRDWHPMSFAKMGEWLAPAKMNFACSANYTDHVDTINLTDEQQAFLKGIPDPMFRQSVRDFMCNTQFRKDYWIKGTREIETFERGDLLKSQRVMLLSNASEVELKVNGSRGEASLNQGVYTPILNVLAAHKPLSLGQLEQAVQGQGITFAQVLQAIIVLAGKGDVAVVQDEPVIAKAKRQTDKLNQHLLLKSRGSNDIAYLASPVIGGAIGVNRFHQLFLLAKTQGKKTPQEWVAFTWQHLQALNQRLIKDGQTLQSPEENLARLNELAQEFAEKRLPILKALQITH